MGQKAQFPFVGGAYLSRSLNLDAQRCVNLYPVLGESGTAKSVRALFGTPGLRRHTTLPGVGGVRALYRPTNGADAIVVQADGSIYRMLADYTILFVGLITASNSLVSIDDDGTTAVMVTGPDGYTLDLATNTLTQIINDAFYGSDSVYYNKTFFVLNRPGTTQFYLMSLDETHKAVFDPLDFASTTSNAEAIVRHIVNHEDVVILKESVIEIWRATGGGDFLYSRDTNAAIVTGCQAKWSVVEMDNTLYWLGGNTDGDGIVWRLNGYTPTRVSNDGLEYAIQNYGDVSDAEAFTYQQEGHTFYVLSFPTAKATWVYDAATQLWHERAYLRPATGRFERYRARCHMKFKGTHFVGDWEDGRIYILDLNYYQDDTDPMVALRSAPHIAGAGYNEIRHKRIDIDVEAGVGAESGQGINPQIMLRWSNDGGHTWGAQCMLRVGAMGQFIVRATADRLGIARSRTYEVSISDPVKRVFLGAAVDAVDLGR